MAEAKPSRLWTPARLDLLRELFPQQDLSIYQIWAELNQLPGRQIRSPLAVYDRAYLLGLKRRQPF